MLHGRRIAAGCICALALQGCSSEESVACGCPLPDGSAAEADAATADAAAETGLTDAQAQEWLDFCGATFGRQAALSETCCTDAEKATQVFASLQSVVDGFALECRTLLLGSATLGRIALDPSASAQCAKSYQDTWATRGCDMLWTSVDWEASSCRAAVRGQQPEGAACRFRYECADGLTCSGYLAGIDGVCVAPPSGGTCREEESNLVVRDLMDSLLGNHPACQPGLTCVHSAQTFGFCETAAAAGGVCAYDRECAPGLRCHLGVCGAQGPADEGGTCILSTDCAARLWCAQNVCAKRQAAGEPCNPAVDSCKGFCVPNDGGADGKCVEFCGSG